MTAAFAGLITRPTEDGADFVGRPSRAAEAVYTGRWSDGRTRRVNNPAYEIHRIPRKVKQTLHRSINACSSKEQIMARPIRYYMPNTVVFITQIVAGRTSVFAAEVYMQMLKEIIQVAKQRYPFKMLGYVFLPDHFHLLLEPSPPIIHSQIMHSIKPSFTRRYKTHIGISGRMEFWQARYYDHVIRDDDDFKRHLDYIHYNPVKHGHVSKPEEWTHSSFLLWKERGVYDDKWGWALINSLGDMSSALE